LAYEQILTSLETEDNKFANKPIKLGLNSYTVLLKC